MDMLDSIKMELDGNDLLLEDFPEVVYPIQCLDGIANRCNGQLYQGRADAHRLDGQGDRAADDAGQHRPAARSSRWPASRAASAA